MAKDKEAEALFCVPIYIETHEIKLGAFHAHNLKDVGHTSFQIVAIFLPPQAPFPTNISKYMPWEKPYREKEDNAIIGTPPFALLELIFFFKFQAN